LHLLRDERDVLRAQRVQLIFPLAREPRLLFLRQLLLQLLFRLALAPRVFRFESGLLVGLASRLRSLRLLGVFLCLAFVLLFGLALGLGIRPSLLLGLHFTYGLLFGFLFFLVVLFFCVCVFFFLFLLLV